MVLIKVSMKHKHQNPKPTGDIIPQPIYVPATPIYPTNIG